jgi:predicted phosphate transport protein (TIGR00153 family)
LAVDEHSATADESRHVSPVGRGSHWEAPVALRLVPREPAFFDLFEQQATNVLRGAELLRQRLEHFGGLDSAYTTSKEIHDLEHIGDELVAECIDRLNKSFITPFDREDIIELTRALDDVLDWIDSSAERIVILQISRLTPMVTEFTRIIHRSAEEILTAVQLLRHMKNPEPVLRACKRIVQLENDADQVLREALRQLFVDDRAAPLEVIKLKELYENLEMATDQCQDVANILHTIIAKHT